MQEKSKKRLGVCLNEYSDNSVLLNEAQQIVSRERCSWFVIYIENNFDLLDSISKQRLERSIDQAIEMGAEIIRLPSSDVVKGIITAVELYDITHVIVGKRRKQGILQKLIPTVPTKLLKYDAAFEIQVITLQSQDAEKKTINSVKLWRSYLLSVLLVIVLTIGLELIQESMPEYKFNASIYNVSMIYLLAIVFCAVRYGFKPALLASVLSFGFYNFFFITPFYQFGLNQFSDVINFTLFLSASIISVAVAHLYKNNIVTLREREFAASSLHNLSKEVAGSANINDIIPLLGKHLNDIICSEVILLIKEAKLNVVFPVSADTPQDILKLANRVFKTQTVIYESGWALYPMSTARNNIGVVAVKDQGELINDTLIEALCYQVAIAIERSRLMRESEDIKLKHQKESLRSALLSSISHDLKTPLVSIIGSLSSIKHMKESLTDQECEELIGMAIEEAERLNKSITNILSMTKIESGDLTPSKQWIEPKSIFHDSIQRLSANLEHHAVQIDGEQSEFLINVDPVLFIQVIQNLLENAIKYTSNGSKVTLSAFIKHNKVIMEYRDNGQGIPRKDHKRILNKFTRIENRDAAIAGTGLGFAICKAIIEIHGGQMRLRDNPEGPGLSVVITLNEYQHINEQQ